MSKVVVALVMSLVTVSAYADGQAEASGNVVLGSAGPAAIAENCVEVEIGGERTSGFDCVNYQLQREVARVRPPRNIAPVDTRSLAVHVGGFNQTALRQQYGPSFGESIVPFRPVPRFAPPLPAGP